MSPSQTLFEQTLLAAKAERDRIAAGADLITRDDAVAEVNPMGSMRWYLHPYLEAPSTRALYFHELEIPEGSRSGKLFCQGGMVHLVLSGHGYTVVDGVRHPWEEDDAIVIPIKEDGVTYQHFNDGIGTVRMLVSWPNLDSAVGPEGGVAMEVVEPCPEWSRSSTSGD